MGIVMHELGMVADHMHIAVSIPPKYSVSEVVQRIKGSSSRTLGEGPVDPENPWHGWQQEYGVMTFGERSLANVVDYVRNQKTHHANGTTLAPFEQIERIRPT
jgi:REP element-mobilizing transposase RayT